MAEKHKDNDLKKIKELIDIMKKNDLVEVEISFAGPFFRGPKEEIGFVDLVPYLERDGLYDRIVQTRFAPYMSRKAIYGLPHDVHPVALAYRRDIFEEAAGMLRFEIKVVIIGSRPEAKLLHLHGLRLLPAPLLLLLLLVPILAVVNDLANRRIGIRSNLDEV